MENTSLETVNIEVPVETDKLKTEVKSEVVDRENKEAKCCYTVKKDSGKCIMCVVKTWSLCLNFCECICKGCSNGCLFCSAVCLGCNKCLEQVDCDSN
jgi:hypothetical protein